MSCLPEPDPIAADRRRRRLERRFGPDPVCVRCGMDDLAALIPVPVALLEEHHPLGRAAGPEAKVPLCRHCHAVQTAAQHDAAAVPPAGRHRPRPDSVLERLARALRSVAIFFHALAVTLYGYADRLFGVVEGLDRELPDWRARPWAA